MSYKINTKCCRMLELLEVKGAGGYYTVYYKKGKDGTRRFMDMKEFLEFHPQAKRPLEIMISWLGD